MKAKLYMIRGGWVWWVVCCLFVQGISVSCVRLAHRSGVAASQFAPPARVDEARTTRRININTAGAAELEKLPGIGRALAASIVAYRERYGRFRRAEHLMMVRGIGDRRFRQLRSLITVE